MKEAFDILKPALEMDVITYKGGKGKVEVSVNADPENYLKNFDYARTVVNNHKGKMLVRTHLGEGKKPEWNGVVGDRTQMDGANIKSYIDSSFKKCKTNGQLGAFENRFLAFDFLGKLTKDNYEAMVAQLNSKIQKVDFVILKNGEKTWMIQSKKFNPIITLKKIKRELL